MRRERTNVIDLGHRRARDLIVAAKVEEWWSPGRFRTKPAWYVGAPFLGVTQIENDIRNAEDWAWLTQQIHQLRAMYEARTGRELPEEATAWCEDRDDELDS
ncbi:MAG TPA: hypothetical protein VGS01_08885 [Candidatus Limnocylindria bacterium]|nr:hypothetical protein [Candidatus Limnocylindria bacterium]